MKIICIGQNYPSHNKEMNRPPVADPVLFMKPDTALLHNDENRFYIPDFSQEVHYEAEVVVRIIRMGKNIAERFAHRYYDGVTLGIDFTARDLQSEQKANGLPWEIAKAFDNSAAVGSFLSKEAFPEGYGSLNFELQKNGVTVQKGNTQEMIFSIDRIVAFASRFFTLKTGDLIFTGTPAGVGPVRIGDRLNGFIGDVPVLDVEIG